jgi:hypothetical protein
LREAQQDFNRCASIKLLYAAIHEFKLPLTGMELSYPKTLMVRPNGDRSTLGLEPDLQISTKSGIKDSVLEEALSYLKGK